MRKVLFIGASYCGKCKWLLENVVAPLAEKHPEAVSVHYGRDQEIFRVNERKRIKTVPLFVVENDGEEEFRFSGNLSAEQIEGIIAYEGEVLTLDDVLCGNR